MNINWLFCVLLLQDCIRDVAAEHLGESVKAPNWVDSLIKHIQESTNARQVTLIANFDKNESMVTSPNMGELFTKIVQKFPTLQINVEEFNASEKLLLHHRIEDDTFFDSSTTFIICIHYFRKPFGTLPSQNTIDTMLEISAFKLGTQFLLVLVSQKLSDNLKEFFKDAWAQQLLDLTIIEFVENETPGIAIDADYEAETPIIHQFNPFKKEYTRTNWTSDTKWFPDKVLDMLGHPLKIGVIHRPPFSVATFDNFLEPVNVEGANIDLLKIIAKKLNFTVKYMPHLSKFRKFKNTATPRNIYILMQSGKIDIMAYLSPHYSQSMKNRSLRTTTIRLNSLCTVVPILPRVAMPFSLGFFQAYFVYFGIVIVFWLFSRTLRFKSRSWYPFNIARTLLGITAVWLPTRISERTLYACLLLVSGIVSSSIYTAITGISLQTNAEINFESFSDLDESGLTPMISSSLFNKTFRYNDDTLIKLKKKTMMEHPDSMSTCPDTAAEHKNISCLLMSDEAMIAVQNSARHGRPKIKVTKPCFWSDSTAFLLGKGSPYRSRINHVIMLLKDTGVLTKCYKEKINTVWDDDDSGLDRGQNMKDLRRQLYAIAIVGYTLSIFAFIGEIGVDRILRCRSLKKGILRK